MIIAASLTLALAPAIGATGQDVPTSPEAFVRADNTQKAEALHLILRHDLKVDAATVAHLIGLALGDKEPRIREAALAAIVSRAAGPNFDRTGGAVGDWLADREEIAKLRPRAVKLLDDAVEDVRLQAIGAVASLDFDLSKSAIDMSPQTERLLIQHFDSDPSARVRAKIASGFGTDPAVASDAVQALLNRAFQDPDYRVRHAAVSGVGKLHPVAAVELVVRQLADQNRSVRLQAASVLARFGPLAAGHLHEIEESLAGESDNEVRRLLEVATAAIRRR